MTATESITDFIRRSILETCRAESRVKVDRRQIDAGFPHPEKLGFRDIDDMITLAIVGNIPSPPEDPTQKEQIAAFCEEHGLIFSDNGWEHFVTFLAKGMPAQFKDRTKSDMRDCEVGDVVHESNVPKHSHGKIVKCIPRMAPDPFWYGTREATEIATITPMTFERLPLHNGEYFYQRVS